MENNSNGAVCFAEQGGQNLYIWHRVCVCVCVSMCAFVCGCMSACVCCVLQGLEKQLKVAIEQDAVSKASHSEPKTLTILKPSASSQSSSSAKSNKKK